MLHLPSLEIGARVQNPLRVVERSERSTRDGSPFVVLTLGNATGQIEAKPIWSNQLDWVEGAERGTVVQVIGQLSRYENNGTARRQIEITAPLRPLPREGIRMEDFLPRIEQETEKLWGMVDDARGRIASPTLRRVLGLFFDDESFRVAFELVPASIGGHHSKVGGLLLHVCEVMHIARGTARAMKADEDVVIAGALLHDIGKVESYEVTPAGFQRTACGNLIEHVVLGAMMLERRALALGERVCSDEQLLELQHIILSHHGSLEFGSPVRPLTLEAEIIHWADESSAKANDMQECLADAEGFGEGEQFADRKRLWRVEGRRLWRRGHDWR